VCKGGGRAKGARAGGEGEGRVAGTGRVAAEEGSRGGCQTEDDGTRGVEEESKGGTGGRSGKYLFSLFDLCFYFADSCVDVCIVQSIVRCVSTTQRSRSSRRA